MVEKSQRSSAAEGLKYIGRRDILPGEKAVATMKQDMHGFISRYDLSRRLVNTKRGRIDFLKEYLFSVIKNSEVVKVIVIC